MSVELEEVVGGGDEVDLGLHRGFAASQDSSDPADVFPMAEDGFDDRLGRGAVLAL